MAKRTTRRHVSRPTAKEGKLNFAGLWLIESSSKLGQMKKEKLPEHANQLISVNIMIPDDLKAAAVNIKVKLGATYEGEEAKDPAISVFASFLVNYVVTEKFPTREALSSVVERMAMLHIWPYWREFVQTMTSRMGLPPFPVPLVYVDELVKKKEPERNS